MKCFTCRKIVLSFFLFTPALNSFSQLSHTDSAAYVSSINIATAVYHKALYPALSLYSGAQYYGYAFRFRSGHPFYQVDEETTGWIKYDGILYENVRLRYDLIREKVIVTHPGNQSRICVLSERITVFSMYSTTFIYIKTDSVTRRTMPDGIYALLYDGGNIKLLKKNKKVIAEELTTAEGVLRDAMDQNSYYIQQGKIFHIVSSKKDVLRIMGEKRKEVQQYIRKNNLDLRHDKEGALVKLIAFYDTIETNH